MAISFSAPEEPREKFAVVEGESEDTNINVELKDSDSKKGGSKSTVKSDPPKVQRRNNSGLTKEQRKERRRERRKLKGKSN